MKLFAWVLETAVLGAIVLYFLKKHNIVNKLVSDTKTPEHSSSHLERSVGSSSTSDDHMADFSYTYIRQNLAIGVAADIREKNIEPGNSVYSS